MSRRPKKYLIDDIRSRFQTVALDNKYQIFIEPNLDVYNASADVGIERRFIDEDLGLYVSDAVLPGSSFADIEVSGDRQGITERMPFKRIYDDVTFTFMVDRYYKVMRFFEAWTQLINPLHGQVDGKANNQVMTLSYPKDYKCTLSVAKFNKDYFETGAGFLYYCFIKAWPLSISSAPINYESGSILKLNVTFRYERYVMENVNRGQIRSGWKGYSDSFDPWLGRYNEFDTPYVPPKDSTTVKSATQLAVDRDNRIYGNTMPSGAFGITSNQSNLYSGLKGFKTEPQYDAYGSYHNGQLPGGNDPLRFKNKEYKRNNLNQNLP
tara:strand:+ start:29 stop:997 length:969 start_codon:yes stop_codon:yes gene_type:complete